MGTDTMGTTDLTLEDAPELIKLSEITVYHSEENIAFIIKLLLVYQTKLTLYKLIPKPVDIYYGDNIHFMYIKNNYDYITISKSKKYYTSHKPKRLNCKQSKNFILCLKT